MFITSSSSIGLLIAELTDEDESKQIRAAKMLVRIGRPALKDLVETLDTFDDDQWLFSAAIFVQIGKPAVEILARNLSAKSDPARKRIVWILGQIGDKDTTEPLRAILASGDDSIQEVTVEALLNIAAVNLRMLLPSPKNLPVR